MSWSGRRPRILSLHILTEGTFGFLSGFFFPSAIKKNMLVVLLSEQYSFSIFSRTSFTAGQAHISQICLIFMCTVGIGVVRATAVNCGPSDWKIGSPFFLAVDVGGALGWKEVGV